MPNPDAHARASRTHREAARRHEEAAEHWEKMGDPERAELSRRGVQIERDAAVLEDDWAQLYRERERADRVKQAAAD